MVTEAVDATSSWTTSPRLAARPSSRGSTHSFGGPDHRCRHWLEQPSSGFRARCPRLAGRRVPAVRLNDPRAIDIVADVHPRSGPVDEPESIDRGQWRKTVDPGPSLGVLHEAQDPFQSRRTVVATVAWRFRRRVVFEDAHRDVKRLSRPLARWDGEVMPRPTSALEPIGRSSTLRQVKPRRAAVSRATGRDSACGVTRRLAGQ